jgi:hypothetical protein
MSGLPVSFAGRADGDDVRQCHGSRDAHQAAEPGAGLHYLAPVEIPDTRLSEAREREVRANY